MSKVNLSMRRFIVLTERDIWQMFLLLSPPSTISTAWSMLGLINVSPNVCGFLC